MGDENKTRGNWASKCDYLFSLAGYCVGLANVWRFPYLCYKNGGGAFLFPYMLMVTVVGMPLFLLETALGQFASSGCVTVYNAVPMFKGVGYASLLVSVIASFYYTMIVAYPLVYLFYSLWYSFSPSLPWSSCDNPWNTPSCSSESLFSETNTTDIGPLVSPAVEFFHKRVLGITGGLEESGGMMWSLVLASFIVWALVYLCIFKGVKVVGKVVWMTALFPYVMLLILFIRGVTLPGAITGIRYYLYPNFNRLLNTQVWSDAAVQVFFSLGPGWGTLITMSSFNKYHNNVERDILIIPIINALTSIFAGFVVFSVLGFLSYEMNLPVEEVATSGPSLAFITYPEALSLLPIAPFWSALFFLMLFFLGLDSCFIQAEAVVSSIVDAWPNLRPMKALVALAVCGIIFLGSLSLCAGNGMYLLVVMDNYSVTLTVFLTTFLTLITFSFAYGVGRLFRDLESMVRRPLSFFWHITWLYITPPILAITLVSNHIFHDFEMSYGDYIFPVWAKGLGWVFSLCSVLAIPAYFVVFLVTAKGSIWQRMASTYQPTSDWGPALEVHRAEWQDYCASHPIKHRYYHIDADCSRASHHPEPEAISMKPINVV